MKKRKTKEQFIFEAKQIHGNKYNYNNVNYTNTHAKVDIICSKHGIFKQIAKNHLNGQGCPKCAGLVKLNTKQFIERAQLAHGNKYDYSKANYKNSKTKIIIICPIHGDFKQIPISHFTGKGCAACANNIKLTEQDFINKVNKIHNNKYTYSKINYINLHTKIIITCKEHGDFEQTPANHYKYGCPECAGIKRLTSESFTKKSKKVHGPIYDYSKVNYYNTKTKVEIICLLHGGFFQIPADHLRGSGCPKCVSSISKAETEWLDHLNIPNQYRNKSIKIKGKLFKPDAVIKNTIYEFYGDYWHGNPDVYNLNDINPSTKCTYRKLYENTILRENIIKNADYKLITIWENDWISCRDL